MVCGLGEFLRRGDVLAPVTAPGNIGGTVTGMLAATLTSSAGSINLTVNCILADVSALRRLICQRLITVFHYGLAGRIPYCCSETT
jgi:hypothetical protein